MRRLRQTQRRGGQLGASGVIISNGSGFDVDRIGAALAHHCIEMILIASDGNRFPTGDNDPHLVAIRAVVRRGLKYEGFAAEFTRQADSAGIILNAIEIADFFIANLQQQRPRIRFDNNQR